MIVENFESEVVKNPKPVVVDFYADWCGPCKMFAPIFEKTAEKYSDDVEFKKVDVEKMADDASKFGVMSIPTIVIFKGGEEVSRHTGFMNEADFLRWVESNA
jgi:thioredoxin